MKTVKQVLQAIAKAVLIPVNNNGVKVTVQVETPSCHVLYVAERDDKGVWEIR